MTAPHVLCPALWVFTVEGLVGYPLLYHCQEQTLASSFIHLLLKKIVLLESSRPTEKLQCYSRELLFTLCPLFPVVNVENMAHLSKLRN